MIFDSSIIIEFVSEASSLINEISDNLLQLEDDVGNLELINAIFRGFHTIKGAAGFLQLEEIVHLCHSEESLFDAMRSGESEFSKELCSNSFKQLDRLKELLHALMQNPDQQDDKTQLSPDNLQILTTEIPKKSIKQEESKSSASINQSIKVDTAKLDKIVNLVGELVLLRNRLLHLTQLDKNDALTVSDWFSSCSQLNTLTCDLQAAVMQTRMQPLKPVFSKFKRLVRDTALELNKEVELKIINAETELDKNLVEALENPLIHLLRNALDHGIESPKARLQAGKSPHGTIEISAKQVGEQIIINIGDDGAGLNPDKIRQAAINKGLIDENTVLTEQQYFNLILTPGFSTKDDVSAISGRGVGMDVVKTNISKMGGLIEFRSKLGEGTNIEITLPLTLAILPTLMVQVSSYILAFAVSCIKEIIAFDIKSTKKVGEQMLINVRGSLIPLFYLTRILHHFDEGLSPRYVVITQTANGHIGFAVDNLLGQEEVIIKPLNHHTNVAHGFSGATITSAGYIALVLDVAALVALQMETNYVH